MSSPPELTTRRQALASVLVCQGCCCGRVDRGRPPVPVVWLKAQFKQQRLLHRVHLTITGCLGPCDIPNIVGIVTGDTTIWLGGLDHQEHWMALVAWAVASRDAAELLPLPPALAARRFERFVPLAMASTTDRSS